MKSTIELINALGPFLQYATPLLLVLLPLWIRRDNKKTVATATAAQTVELKAHSDATVKKIVDEVMSASGNYKTLPTPPPPDAR